MEIRLNYKFAETIYTSNPEVVHLSPYYCHYYGEIYVNSGSIEPREDMNSLNMPSMLCAGKFSIIHVDIMKMESEDRDALEAVVATPRIFDAIDDLIEMSSYNYKKEVLDLSPIKNKNIIFLKRLEVFPKFRARKIGLFVSNMIISRFSSFAGVVVTDFYPLQFDKDAVEANPVAMGYQDMITNKDVANQRIVDYFAQLEFKSVVDTPYFVKFI